MRDPDGTAPAANGLEYVEVSAEMTLLLGEGPMREAPVPPDAIALVYADEATPTLTVDLAPDLSNIAYGGPRLVLLIERRAFTRIGGILPDDASCEHGFHLPSALRAIVLAIRGVTLQGETQMVYRLGKSIELLCETIRLLGEDDLVPVGGDGVLSLDDSRRIVAARRMIDERWNEKLTLDAIARACGLNRAKLTRGFREMFGCTIAETLAERRLSQASKMLLTTDLPVSSIGYENGYLNNASFARAFARRFGVSPSDFRAAA